eukprot:7377607-Prymnesium_polylepis.1
MRSVRGVQRATAEREPERREEQAEGGKSKRAGQTLTLGRAHPALRDKRGELCVRLARAVGDRTRRSLTANGREKN